MPLHEFARPWKLVTLVLGIAILIAGAFIERSPDWDVGISVIMAVMTYFTAPWAMRVLLERRWKWLPLAALYTWLTVDGVYWAYNRALPDIEGWREANFPASLALYGICGILWLYRGSLSQFRAELSARFTEG